MITSSLHPCATCGAPTQWSVCGPCRLDENPVPDPEEGTVRGAVSNGASGPAPFSLTSEARCCECDRRIPEMPRVAHIRVRCRACSERRAQTEMDPRTQEAWRMVTHTTGGKAA